MDQTQLRSPDVYGRTFQMDAQTLGVIVTRLEARGRHPFFLRAIAEYMDELALAGTESILDLGCGTGVAARAIARRPEVRGPVTAIDISGHLVEAGRRLAEEEGLGGRIDFRVGDAHGLGLPERGLRCGGDAHAHQPRGRPGGGAGRGAEAPQAGDGAARRVRRRLRLADPGYRRGGWRRGDRPGRAAGHHRPAARHAGHAAPAGRGGARAGLVAPLRRGRHRPGRLLRPDDRLLPRAAAEGRAR